MFFSFKPLNPTIFSAFSHIKIPTPFVADLLGPLEHVTMESDDGMSWIKHS